MKPVNQMTIEECKMAHPKQKWLQTEKSPTMKAEIPEATLQNYANEAIALRGWSFIRFSSAFMGWLKRHAPEWAQRAFFTQVGGKMPDNIIMSQVAPGLFLAMKMEIKTADTRGRAVGKLHGKQKNYAEAEGWYIVRSPEQINMALDELAKATETVKKTLYK